MYIQPETNIRILRNVPLDTTYEHTIYFGSKSAQYNYFAGLTKYNLTNYTYQRVKRGVCRVGIKADNLYDCNYMMFQNKAYGDKWFYAYITSVEFVNNECAEISFELDVIQTWFFDCEPDYCFVEREHTVTDAIGEHIEPEAVDTGEYIFNTYEPIKLMRDMVVAISIADVDGGVDGTLYDGVYGGTTIWAYDSTDTNGINAKLNEYTEKPDSIVGMYMFPKLFIGSIPDNHRLNYGASASATVIELNGVTNNTLLDGYKPKNKKLYTYPYNFYHVDNGSGSSLILRYEFFNKGKPVVQISGTVTQPVSAVLRPCAYKGLPSRTELSDAGQLFTESIALNNYPICSWSFDAYQAWVAQNAIPIGINGVASVAKLSAVSDSPFMLGSGERGIIGQVASVLTQAYKASISADITKGNLNNGCVNVANNVQQFNGGRCSVSKEYAKMIDDYFSMFGYSVRRIKKPNRFTRPHWNYVKTIGATITGSVPADDMRKICQIYDAGITFWKRGSEVGRYDLDNSV